MDLTKLAQSLHAYERAVLPHLDDSPTVTELAQATSLQEVEVTRALQWLENKNAVRINTKKTELAGLDANGKAYRKSGLPERRFLEALDKEMTLRDLAKKAKLGKDEVNVCIGLLRRQNAITFKKDKEPRVDITKDGKKLLAQGFPEEQLLSKPFPLDTSTLNTKEQSALEQLKKRKHFIVVDTRRTKRATLTALGEQLRAKSTKTKGLIDTVTPQLLRTGEWKNKPFRRYDVTINVPHAWGGKKQPYRSFLDWVRQKFTALGFQEMDGPLVETEFYNMDALYMPQFHSARDIHDAYYAKEPQYGTLPKELVKRVKAAHETGGNTGSKGWQYPFDEKRTHRHVLRTQGTACSARMLASKDLQIPGKYFGITRVFRHDVIDATHLPDFNQTEGIIVEEGLTFRHLVGLLTMFAKEFAGTDDIRLVPGYFPFTEPSVEIFAKHPQLGWVELGGAGIFRPEVVKPLLGKNIPVLAWGLGIDRLGMFKLGIKDIRDLFTHDLEKLRTTPVT